MGNMEDMEDLEKLREKEFAERVEKIQNTISLFRKIAALLQQTQFQNQKLLMHRQCTAIPSEMRYNIVFFIFQKENKEMSEKRCYTVQELQEILGVSRSTIYNRC